ncbi:MAG TPA: ABC transporter ATP-binding protein [Actinophytocola sp.]|uniref:ABC transporter ATP-binding protein n=1 Tax=Actinophytocola sp. TaxID=1872138 RepID=UPI002DB5AD94|nr:ABC transporter ATP-binding protein [Actinophytocola sp.]HEU5472083.1 ABC transporter ATP-binding protein [Actinophytocola sp.]
MGLAVRDLTVRYGQLTAVSGVHLEVADGEVVALLGPSGCGKSTLLRAVAGLERPAAGAVCWDGADLAPVAVHRRGFGLVFQDGQLFPHRDVAGNVEFGLRMAGVDRAGRRARVAELLDLLGLAGYQDRRITELSGGEQQRVALARALAPRPRLLLLDEPLSALDRALREQLALDLARVLRVSGSTALVVTHDHDEAFTLADRVALMRVGRIVQTGRPEQVWRAPADEHTARFLGCGTFLPATAAGGVVSCALGTVALPGVPDGPVRLGLRPTALRSDHGGRLRGETLARVHRRDHVRLLVRLDAGLDGPVDAVAGIADAPEAGDPVRLSLDPDGIAVLSRP